ncbi:GNAT family N-acetyltransferase [Dyadobacter psychrotolerans]|uniref:GNAT family N-acetyltransferase n=1 Tax=Dyadobacter psychrotolerans TaxID=2541721 RepID=A0A4V6PFV6_9BACT|nr:GNAT family N-acetyltransferase [Dyadobacter psychrotolerans]TDE17608.1 GNAT family N-acetyltransferase [Dyadobacter psychrotolerans]
MEIVIREIRESDNKELAAIIRQTLKEFKADKPGTVYYDQSTDHLSDLFLAEKSKYFVAELDGRLVGGAGLFPTEGLPDDTLELVKMYLLPEARSIGLGKKLILTCVETAVANGYKKIYLETMNELQKAVQTYNRLGFRTLDAPLGNSGHHSCEIWMLKDLD